MSEYARSRSAYRHREDILRHLGYSAFEPEHQQAIAEEAHRLAHLQTRPALMLDALAGYLREKRVEIPSYSSLRSVLTEALDGYQAHLEDLIEGYLSADDRTALDVLLTKQSGTTGSVANLLRYRLTYHKRISQSMQRQRPTVHSHPSTSCFVP